MKYILAALFIATARADEVEQMLRLRKDVEVLSQEVESLQKSSQAKIDVYIQEQQDLESKLFQEKVRLDQIRASMKSWQKDNKIQDAKSSDATAKWAFEFIALYEKNLDLATPMHASPVRSALSKTAYELKNHRITDGQALITLWFTLESDLRKSLEVEYELIQYKEGDKVISAQSARLGRSLAFVRTADGRYGLHKGKKIQYFTNSKEAASLDLFIGQLKKQERSGLFKLPGLYKTI